MAAILTNRLFQFWMVIAIAILFLLWIWKWGDNLEPLFAYSTFYLLLATLVLFVVRGQEQIWPPAGKRSLFLLSVVIVLMVCGAIFLVVEPTFRILADETNLLSTSRNLLLDQELRNIRQNHIYYGSDHVLSEVVAHRPALFPLLTSLLHYLLGFRWYNGFVLNFLVLATTLLVTYHAARSWRGPLFGTIAALLMASFPILVINVTSSGFDALNMLMSGIFWLLLIRFLAEPGPQRLELMLLAAILAAQVRYESMALLLPAGLALLLHLRKAWYWQFRPSLLLLPVLALPIFWQKLVSSHFANVGQDVEAFDLTKLPENVVHLAEFLVDWADRGYATQRITVLFAVVGVALLLWLRPRLGQRSIFWFLGLFAIGHGAVTVAHLAYQYGDMRLAWVNRLVQVHLIWIVPLAALAIHQLHGWLRSQPALVLLLLAIWIEGVSEARQDTIGNTLTLRREFNYAREFIQPRFDPDSTLIIVDGRPNMYAALGYSAVDTKWANSNLGSIRVNIERKLYTDVLHVSRRNFSPFPRQRTLDGDFLFENLFTRQILSVDSVTVDRLSLKE
jgi:hypothetical protein